MKKTGTILLLCTALLLSGCKIGEQDIVMTNAIGSRQVFKIGKKSCEIEEVKVYLTNYQNIYGTAYGINLWEHDFGEDSLEDYIRKVTLDELTKVFCMDLLAEANEVILTEDEETKIGEAAKEYFASLSKEEIDYMDVSESDIAEFYGHYALAQKIYHQLTEGVNEEVSDDEARIMELMQIFVSTSEKAREVRGRLAEGEDFAAVANNYNELPSIQITVSRDDLPAEVEEAAFRMDNDEISDQIESEGGYYFIKCLNKYNEELTEANKSNIVEKREKEAFYDAYNDLLETLSSQLNEEVWGSIVLADGEEIATDSFFAVYERYCGEI